jgi:hypothetical protein
VSVCGFYFCSLPIFPKVIKIELYLVYLPEKLTNNLQKYGYF